MCSYISITCVLYNIYISQNNYCYLELTTFIKIYSNIHKKYLR